MIASAALSLTLVLSSAAGEAIRWERWSPAIFERARAEHRFVILDLGAVWCHWCHVMDEVTYQDPAVAALISAHYLAVRADQDAEPELSNRYEDYGWPATIVFAPDGSELVRRRGFIKPLMMAAMLQAIVDDPTPGPSVRGIQPVPEDSVHEARRTVSAEDRRAIETAFLDAYDTKHGGWGFQHRYIHTDSMEYALVRAAEGDARAAGMAKTTLERNRALIDPVWGGVYQYSDQRDPNDPWSTPHYEKIMWFQAADLRLYALAYAQWKDAAHLRTARDIDRYLERFLTAPNGAFYTSQDADLGGGVDGASYFALGDAERRARGMPRIDTHTYARENGWAIAALASLADVSGDERVLARAVRAAEVMLEQRGKSAGFVHGDDPRPFLGDTLAMGQALLALYASTADRRWLDEASASLAFIAGRFRDPRGGFMTAIPTPDAPGELAKPVRQMDENMQLARFANLLSRYTGDPAQRAIADHALGFITAPQRVKERRLLAGVLLAADEAAREPLHLVIVGPRGDPAAKQLFAAARALPASYRRLEWWDPKGPRLPNHDVEYPALERAAAFVCDRGACSRPLFDARELPETAARLLHPKR